MEEKKEDSEGRRERGKKGGRNIEGKGSVRKEREE